MKLRTKFILILVLAAVMLIVAYPKEQTILKRIGIQSNLQVKRGLDLQGGAHLVYQADLSGIKSEDKVGAMKSLTEAIQRRVNPGGTSEVTVQTAGNDRVIVELPGVKDLSQAIRLIGQTANLAFLEVPATGDAVIQTGISGKDVDRATVDFPQTGSGAVSTQPIVRLKMKGGESTKKFAVVTERINKNGNRLVTLLDQQIVFGPASVSSPITDGVAQLTGDFTVKQAKEIEQLINAGALPVPISLGEQRTVGPSLGQEAVGKSLIAGLIGLTVLAAFMIIYYRLAGAVAVAALALYTLINVAIFKISGLTPYIIVLTLAGIAGFILSIGMAVDANILIFERMKEELRSGKNFVSSLEAGYDRAWTSIRDSNVATLISTVILYNFGSSIIKGFAITLAIGVLVSMFTAIVVSRTFLRMLIRTKAGRNPKYYGIKGVEA